MNNEETPNTPPKTEPTPQTPTPEQTPSTQDAPQASPPPSPAEPIQPGFLNSTPEAPAPAAPGSQDGVWVSKAEYDASKTAVEEAQKREIIKSNKTRWFFRFLAITGLLIAILYIGMLISPSSYAGVRGECTRGAFLDVAFWLNPVAYFFLLFTGIVGTTTKRPGLVALGILFIIAAPIAWFITGIGILGPIFCGV